MRIKPQKIDLQGLSPAAVSLLQGRPTRLFSPHRAGAVHDLTVLVQVAARHSFFIGNAFNRSGSKRYREQHATITGIAVRACNDLAALHEAMSKLGKDGKMVAGEWPVFKTSALGRRLNKSLPQFLAKALEANIRCLLNHVTATSEKPIENRTEVIRHATAAVSELQSLAQEMDRIYKCSKAAGCCNGQPLTGKRGVTRHEPFREAPRGLKTILLLDREDQDNGKTIQGLTCPACGDKIAWTYADGPMSMNCNPPKSCGARTKTLEMFPEVRRNIESDFPRPKQTHPPSPGIFNIAGLGRFSYRSSISVSQERPEVWHRCRHVWCRHRRKRQRDH